jgi:hypothetical protein
MINLKMRFAAFLRRRRYARQRRKVAKCQKIVFDHMSEIKKHWEAIYAMRRAFQNHPWEF